MDDKVCRLCLGRFPKPLPPCQTRTTEMLQSIASIKVAPNEARICIQCHLKVNLAHRIQQDLTAADRKFRQMGIGELEIKEEEPETEVNDSVLECSSCAKLVDGYKDHLISAHGDKEQSKIVRNNGVSEQQNEDIASFDHVEATCEENGGETQTSTASLREVDDGGKEYSTENPRYNPPEEPDNRVGRALTPQEAEFDLKDEIVLEPCDLSLLLAKLEPPNEDATKKRKNSGDFETSNITGAGKVEVLCATSLNGKRIRDKLHSCYFCHQMLTNMARHFEIKHAKEEEVARLLPLSKYSKERRDGFGELLKAGDFYHNCNVLETKDGPLVLVRRPSERELQFVTYSDYGPCPYCLGFMLKKHLWHHIKLGCTKSKQSEASTTRHVVAESESILNHTFGGGFSDDYLERIVSKLRNDGPGRTAEGDPLILRFGAMQFQKYGPAHRETIRQTMRQLARLKLALERLDHTDSSLTTPLQSLEGYLTPDKFDQVVEAARILGRDRSSAMVVKIGYALKKCCGNVRGWALRRGDLQRDQEVMAFHNLVNKEWHRRVVGPGREAGLELELVVKKETDRRRKVEGSECERMHEFQPVIVEKEIVNETTAQSGSKDCANINRVKMSAVSKRCVMKVLRRRVEGSERKSGTEFQSKKFKKDTERSRKVEGSECERIHEFQPIVVETEIVKETTAQLGPKDGVNPSRINAPVTVFKRNPWSLKERKFVLNYFKENVKSRTLPGKADCERCLEESEGMLLGSRKWTDLKFCMKNFFSRLQKGQTV